MKKLLAMILAMLTLLSLAACGSTKNNKIADSDPSEPFATEPSEPAVTEPSEPQAGNEPGDRCPSFQVELADVNGPTGEFADPTATGKITVINFWGTWCNPCTSELPHFDQLARDYDVNVFAIHSTEGKRKMPEFIAKNYPDSPLIFAYDEPPVTGYLDKYFTLLGGSTGYPYTVILDENGIVLYSQTGMMSYEQLEAVIKE